MCGLRCWYYICVWCGVQECKCAKFWSVVVFCGVTPAMVLCVSLSVVVGWLVSGVIGTIALTQRSAP